LDDTGRVVGRDVASDIVEDCVGVEESVRIWGAIVVKFGRRRQCLESY